MKKLTRRTKRMIAIILVYMIVVINVVTAYADEPTVTTYSAVENEDGEIVVETMSQEKYEEATNEKESSDEE